MVAALVVAALVSLNSGPTPSMTAGAGAGVDSGAAAESPTAVATTYLKSFADDYSAGAAVVSDDRAATTAGLNEIRAGLKPDRNRGHADPDFAVGC
jgi:hypothetical protein